MANTAAVKLLMGILQREAGVSAHDIQTVIDGLDEIRSYSTETALLADSTVPDGLLAYAADTFNVWFRRNSAWSQRLASGQLATVVSKTSAYTATVQDEVILVDATAGAVIVTLPAAASSSGRKYQVKKIDSSANAVTVDPNSSEVIDGAATRSIVLQWGSLSFVCNGTAWYILAQDTRAYATEAALLADTVPDGTIAFAQDTFNLWFRRNGAWSQRTAAGQLTTVVSKTGAYTATTAEETILVDATGGAVTITLPAAASNSGRRYSIKKTDAGVNAVTVDPNASELIDGASTKSLATQNKSVIIVCDGTAWWILGQV